MRKLLNIVQSPNVLAKASQKVESQQKPNVVYDGHIPPEKWSEDRKQQRQEAELP